MTKAVVWTKAQSLVLLYTSEPFYVYIEDFLVLELQFNDIL